MAARGPRTRTGGVLVGDAFFALAPPSIVATVVAWPAFALVAFLLAVAVVALFAHSMTLFASRPSRLRSLRLAVR